MSEMKAILVPVDGSANSDRAVAHALELIAGGLATELHFLNVQPNLGGAISAFVDRGAIDSYRRDEGNKALASALELARKASVPAKIHIGVGRTGAVVADFVKKLEAGGVVIGTRGHT